MKAGISCELPGVEELQFLRYLFSIAKGYHYEEGNIILPPSHSKAGLSSRGEVNSTHNRCIGFTPTDYLTIGHKSLGLEYTANYEEYTFAL